MSRRNHRDTIAFRPKPGNVENTLGSITAKFLDRYPRVERAKAFVEMSKEEAAYYASARGYRLFELETPPVADYIEVGRLRLNHLMATNELLCYRILKHVYGAPDIAVALLNASQSTYAPYDWSYCLRIHEAALVEVRRMNHSIFFIVWGLKGSAKEIRQQAATAFKQFVDDISDALRRGLSLFHSKFERKRAYHLGVPNPYVEKYAAARELMGLAKSVDKPADWKRFRSGEPIEHPLTGSVYLAAILFLYIALEAFEQLVRAHLLRADCRTNEVLDEIKRLSLKERLARLDEFCEGFRQSPMPKGGPLYKKLGILSRVRNEVLHGNIPEDLNIYALSEDGFTFMYAPEQDDEGKARSKEYVPFARGSVRRRHAEYVRSLVDEVISAVIDSLMPEHVEFVCGLRRDSVLGKDSDGRIWIPAKL